MADGRFESRGVTVASRGALEHGRSGKLVDFQGRVHQDDTVAVSILLLEQCPRLHQRVSRGKGKIAVSTGTIKKVISDRGFGFIAAEDGQEYFFHRDGLEPSVNFERLGGGEIVTFDIEASPKGPRARRVRLA